MTETANALDCDVGSCFEVWLNGGLAVKQETSDDSETDDAPSKPSLPPSFFDRYRRLGGKDLDDVQELRLSRLMDAFGMQDIMEFEHMILTLEYYLFLQSQGLEESTARSGKLIEEKFGELSRDMKKIEIPKDFLGSLELRGEKVFRHLISKIEEDLKSAGDGMIQFARLAEDTLPLVKEALQNFAAVPERIETRLSENLTNIVALEIEARRNDERWFEHVRRNALFVFLFGFFAIALFLMGMLSYGAGLPPWIAGVVARDEPGFGLLLSVALGLPMSWCLWIGAGVLGMLWTFEHRSSLDSYGNFIRTHAVLAGISVALTAALFGWFLL
jgi:hypothetical protein